MNNTDLFDFVFMSMTVLTGVGAIDVTMPQSQYEFARGDNITLPCSFKSAININTAEAVVITWTALALEANVKDVGIYL